MDRLDKLAVESGLEIKQMMELAGWQMVTLFRKEEINKGKKITIVAGKGNKGGDGLAAARHLINRNFDVSIILAESDLKESPQHHLSLLEKMNVEILLYSQIQEMAKSKLKESDIIIESLLGYNIQGSPRGNYKELINLINNSEGKIISYDLPTGIDPTTGENLDPAVSADVTLTLALPKRGLKENTEKSGKVYLGDIGIPHFMYDRIKRNSRPEFENQGVIKLDLE
jgi:NAD(P)H-hydrate epimerase